MPANHTPGPWFISSPGSTNKLYVGPVVIQSHRTAFPNASTPEALDHIDDDTLYANAQLIAAAPELLAALQQLAQGWATLSDPSIIRGLTEARAAIAKATGSQP